jgi:hypothetical protein
VCTGYGIEHIVASPVPPAGGSQGTGQDLSRGGEVPVELLPRRREHVPVPATATESATVSATVSASDSEAVS